MIQFIVFFQSSVNRPAKPQSSSAILWMTIMSMLWLFPEDAHKRIGDFFDQLSFLLPGGSFGDLDIDVWH